MSRDSNTIWVKCLCPQVPSGWQRFPYSDTRNAIDELMKAKASRAEATVSVFMARGCYPYVKGRG
jgi:hypothetical protein